MRFLRPIIGRHRRGSVVLEAVMALPAMLVLFGAVSQVMITAQSRVQLEQAAYAAARSALVFMCPDFNLIALLQSASVNPRPSECMTRRSELNAIAQARAEDAARWALVAAAPTTPASFARGCDQVPAAKEILTGSDRIMGRDTAAEHAICYVFEPGNVTVELDWVTANSFFNPSAEARMQAKVTFLFPLSTPFRRFILNFDDNAGERGDGTYFLRRTATVNLS